MSKKIVFGIFFFIALTSAVLGQDIFPLPDQKSYPYSVKSWTTANGLPQNSINDILQDPLGFIWVFTNEGAARFDGTSLEVFSPQNTENLLANRLEDAEITQDGIIWCTSSEGYLIRINTYTRSFESIEGNIRLFSQRGVELDSEGNPLIALPEGIYKYQDDTFKLHFNHTVFKEHPIQSFTFDKQTGLFYIGTDQRALIGNQEDGLTKVRLNTKLPDGINTFKANDEIVGFSSDGTFKFYKGKKQHWSINLRDIEENIAVGYSALIDGSNKLLLSSKSGLVIISKNDTDIINTSNGLSSNSVRCVFQDSKQNIWVGTDDYGLNLLTPSLFSRVIEPSGFEPMSTTGTIWSSDSSLWFVRSCNGILRYNFKEKQIQHFIRFQNQKAVLLNQPSTGGNCFWTVHEDDYNNIWVGGFGGGIKKFNGDSFTLYDSDQENVMSRNFCFRQINSNQLWIGSNHGVQYYNYKTESFYSLADSIDIPDIPVNSIYPDSKGRIWLCSLRGIVLIQNGQSTWFNVENGNLSANNFRYAYQDSFGSMWFGSYGNGLFFYEDGVFKKIPISFLEESQAVSWIQEYDGKFWMTSNSGLNAVKTAHLYEYLKGNLDQIEAFHFGQGHGLINDEFNGGFQNSGVELNGKFYLPTVRGLVIFHPNRIRDFHPEKPHIIKTKLDGTPQPLDSSLTLPANFKRLEINISAPIYNQQQNSVIEYKLDGFENQWTILDKSKQATFTKLPSGSYTLNMRNRSIMNGKIAVKNIHIKVERPFWKSPLFLFLAASSLFIVIFLTLYSFSQRSKNREKTLFKIVEERTKELRESRNNISSIIESTKDLVWSIDKHANLIYANQRYLDRFKESNGIQLHKGDNILKLAKPKNLAFWEPILKIGLEGKPYQNIIKRSKQAVENREPYAVSDFTMTPIFDDKSGELLGIVGFSRDITEFHHQQKELEKTKQEALAAAKSKSEFLATMSHEIRTPMNGVIGMTSLLTHTKLTKEQKEYVDTIRVSGDTLLSIINEILDFSKIDAGRLELENHPMDIKQVIKETFELVRTKAEEKNIELKCVIESEVPHSIYGDVTRIRQVLLNLTSNAVKFTKKGYVLIKVSNATEENKIQFSVIDTGIGIEDQKLNNLFKPFHQLDSSTTRKYGGTGLGLAISKKLIDLMHGEIFANSVKGQGSTFSFIIPAPSASDDIERNVNFSFLSNTRVYILFKLSDSDQFISSLEAQGLKTETFDSLDNLKKRLIDQLPFCIILDDYKNLKILDDTQEHFARSQVIRILAHQEKEPKPDKKLHVDIMLNHPVNLQMFTNKLHTIAYNRFEEHTKKIAYHKLSEQIPLNILVAEDNLINQKLVNMMLNKLGYLPDIVANGAEAVSSINRQKYDLIFMDIQMPEMDGFEATSRIIELYGTKRPFIIAMTANAMEGDREKCLENGMDDYVRKPINIDTVRDVIIKWGQS